MTEPPLILTLQLDTKLFALLSELRGQHFPPERNVVPAHITLFHALPGAYEDQISMELDALAGATPSFGLVLPGVRFLGRGVALEVESPELLALRGSLARLWEAWLTPQDRQRYKPHVTIQNKVTADIARRLFEELSTSWQSVVGRAEGLILWRYMGGPWEQAASFAFRG